MTSKLPDDYVPDKVLAFIDQLVYCPDEYKWVLTMAMFVSHKREAFTTVPYILATAEKPATGKSTIAFDIPMMLGFNVESIDKTTTQPALNNMFIERVTPNTAWDDIGKIFGDNGTSGKLSNFYTFLVKSYRKNATTKMSRNGTMMKVPTYGMAFLNGLKNAVPLDLFTRCIWFQMEEAPEGIALRDALDDSVEADAKILKEAIHAWAGQHDGQFTAFMRGQVRRIHPKLEKRKRQLWGPIFAAAYAAGGKWPRRIFDAFVMIALDASEKPVLVPEQRLLLDAADILMKDEVDAIFTSDLLAALRARPTGAYYRESETEYLVQDLFPRTFGQPKVIRSTMLFGEHAGQQGQARGFEALGILQGAVELRDMLYPPMDDEMADPLEEALAFTPTPTPRLLAEKKVAA